MHPRGAVKGQKHPGEPTARQPQGIWGVPSPLCCLDALSCHTLTWQQQPRVTGVSPAPWDVALGLCLGREELQHHQSAQWDSVVGFSRGGRSEAGRAGREKHKQLSPGCDLQATSSVPQPPSRASKAGAPSCSWGTAHPTAAPWPHQPCSTAQPWDSCRTPEPQLGLGRLGAGASLGEPGMGCAALRAAVKQGQLAPEQEQVPG